MKPFVPHVWSPHAAQALAVTAGASVPFHSIKKLQLEPASPYAAAPKK